MKIEKSKLPVRILVFPLVMIITFIYSMWQLFDFWVNFAIYGGEFIALTKNRTKHTITEVFDKVQEMTEKQKATECSHYIGSSRSVKDGVEYAQCIKCKEWFIMEKQKTPTDKD